MDHIRFPIQTQQSARIFKLHQRTQRRLKLTEISGDCSIGKVFFIFLNFSLILHFFISSLFSCYLFFFSFFFLFSLHLIPISPHRTYSPCGVADAGRHLLRATAASTLSPRRPPCPCPRHLLARRARVPGATATLPRRPCISAATAPPRPQRLALRRPRRGGNHALRRPTLQWPPSSPSRPYLSSVSPSRPHPSLIVAAALKLRLAALPVLRLAVRPPSTDSHAQTRAYQDEASQGQR